jgi:hypothetical protein
MPVIGLWLRLSTSPYRNLTFLATLNAHCPEGRRDKAPAQVMVDNLSSPQKRHQYLREDFPPHGLHSELKISTVTTLWKKFFPCPLEQENRPEH